MSYESIDLTGYYAAAADVIRERFERLFEFVEQRMRPARFIDVGTGMGYSLEVAQRRGWQAAGIEPNAALAAAAKNRGLQVEHGYLESNGRPEFDLVLSDNVVEHVTDLHSFVRDLARLMAPGALLIIAVPPIDWLRRMFGTFEFVRDRVNQPQINVFSEVDEHVNMMGRRGMERLLERLGLSLEPTRFHHRALYANPLFRQLGLDDGYYFVRQTIQQA